MYFPQNSGKTVSSSKKQLKHCSIVNMSFAKELLLKRKIAPVLISSIRLTDYNNTRTLCLSPTQVWGSNIGVNK